jgi:hypothetical protein
VSAIFCKGTLGLARGLIERTFLRPRILNAKHHVCGTLLTEHIYYIQ